MCGAEDKKHTEETNISTEDKKYTEKTILSNKRSNDDSSPSGNNRQKLRRHSDAIVKLKTKLNTFRNSQNQRRHSDCAPSDNSPASSPDTTESAGSCCSRFGTVSFRVYNVYVDDNPGVSRGPAIALSGWTFKEQEPIPIDEYETSRPPRRDMEDLKLSAVERENRLKESGASKREVMAHVKRSNIARNKRRETLTRIDNNLPDETIERLVHSVKRFLRLKKSTKQEIKKLWKDANKKKNAIDRND